MSDAAAPVAAAIKPAAQETNSSSNDPDNKKLHHEGWTNIREKKRGCTDIIFLLVLLCAWFAMTIIGFIVTGVIKSTSLSAGNPYRLINTVDYTNHICGYHIGYTDLPFGYYLPDKTAVCVAKCPTTQDFSSFVCKYDVQKTVDDDKTHLLGFYYLSRSQCMYKLKTRVVLNRCVPDVDTTAVALEFALYNNLTGNDSTIAGQSKYPSTASSSASYVSLFWEDVLLLHKVIAPVGLGLSTVVSFAYLYFLRIPGLLFVVIWTILLSILITFILFSILLFTLSVSWATDGVHRTEEVVTMRVFACVGFVVVFAYSCLLVFIRKRVQQAINIIKEAAKAMAQMPLLIAMPILQVVGIVIFLIPWFVYMIYLASSGEMVQMTGTNPLGQTYTYRQFVYTKNTQYTFIFMLFCWFWTAEFIMALGQAVIALAVVGWYFTPNDEKNTVRNGTVLWAMRTVCRYHLGTAAFGSLIIALVQTARAVIAYLQKQAKATKNKVMEYLLCVLQCCMWLLEKCLKFINKNAYIQTAIYGYSFCKAARTAFFLILRNIVRVAVVSSLGDFVLRLGNLLIPSFTTLIAYLIIAYGLPSDQINFIVAPLVLVWLLSYFVSCMFTEIFGMTIDTILCCFVADEEMFPEQDKSFTPESLVNMAKRNVANTSATTASSSTTKNNEGVKVAASDA